MGNRLLLRVGAVAAVSGALFQVLATAFEQDLASDPAEAIRTVAASDSWTPDRLLDLIGGLLTLGALAVVSRTFKDRPAQDWIRAGQVLLVAGFACGFGAVLLGGTLQEVADSWSNAGPDRQEAYIAAFDAMRNTADAFFFGAFLALSLYLATLAAAIMTGDSYPRLIGPLAAASVVLMAAGDLGVLAIDAAFIAVLLGFLLFMVIVVMLGVTMWRAAAAVEPA